MERAGAVQRKDHVAGREGGQFFYFNRVQQSTVGVNTETGTRLFYLLHDFEDIVTNERFSAGKIEMGSGLKAVHKPQYLCCSQFVRRFIESARMQEIAEGTLEVAPVSELQHHGLKHKSSKTVPAKTAAPLKRSGAGF